MTITLTKDIRVAGATLASGTSQTLDASLEADLVARGSATYTTNPMLGGQVPVMADVDRLTRGVSLSANGAGILGIPLAVMSVGTPFVIPPGDGAAVGLQFTGSAGAYTLSAAIITNGWNWLKNGFWLYLPANFGGSAYPAGWYWSVMSSDTAGILYTNTYTSGITAGPSSPTVFPVNLTGWLTTTTSEIVGPTGFTLPAGALGNSGKLASHWYISGNAANVKTFFQLIGDIRVLQLNTAATPIFEGITTSRNVGKPTAQINSRVQTAPIGVGSAAAASIGSTAYEFTAVDTSVSQNLSVTLKVSSTAACAILLGYEALACFGG